MTGAALLAGGLAFGASPGWAQGFTISDSNVEIDGNLLFDGNNPATVPDDLSTRAAQHDWASDQADTGAVGCLIDETDTANNYRPQGEANADDFDPADPTDCDASDLQNPGVIILDETAFSNKDPNVFQSSKEDEPENWQIVEGGSPLKDEISNVYIHTDIETDLDLNGDGFHDTYLFAAMERASNGGDSHVDFEFNTATANGVPVDENGNPGRQEGDFILSFNLDSVTGGKNGGLQGIAVELFAVDSNGDLILTPVFALVIDDDDTNPSLQDLESGFDVSSLIDNSGNGVCPDVFPVGDPCPNGTLIIGVNTETEIAAGPWNSIQKANGPVDFNDPFIQRANFFEAALNLDAVDREPSCPGAAFVTVKSRSSNEITSALKDVTEPQGLDLNTCGQITIVKTAIGATADFDFDSDIVDLSGMRFTDPSTGITYDDKAACEAVAGVGNCNEYAPDDLGTSVIELTLTPASAGASDSHHFMQVDPAAGSRSGSWFFREDGPPTGFTLKSIVCTILDDGGDGSGDSAETVDLEAGDLEIALAPNEHIKCTFTNEAFANLVIKKTVTGGTGFELEDLSGGPFNFKSGLGDFNDKSISTGTDGAGTTMLTTSVVPGKHLANEDLTALPTGFAFQSVSCVDSISSNSGATANTGEVEFDADPGETVTCTFVNFKEIPRLTITKVCEQAIIVGGDTFSFRVGGTVSNTGNVAINNITVTDIPVSGVPTGTINIDGGTNGSFSLAAGASVGYDASNMSTDTTTHSDKAQASGKSAIGNVTVTSSESAVATCSVSPTPGLTITKICDPTSSPSGVRLAASLDPVGLVVVVDNRITLTNTGGNENVNVTLTDDKVAALIKTGGTTANSFSCSPATETDPATCTGTLEIGATAIFEQSYNPTEFSAGSATSLQGAKFKNTAVASFEGVLSGISPADIQSSAECELCP